MKSLIIDIRDNGGGLVTEVLKLADYLIPEGKTIMNTLDKDGKTEVSKSKEKPQIENINIVLLVNDNSASASEILAGALQDNKIATIVGEKTNNGPTNPTNPQQPTTTTFSVKWNSTYGFNPPLTNARILQFTPTSSTSIKRIYFCESNTTSSCSINYSSASKKTKHYDLRVLSYNVYDTSSTYNKTFYFEDLSGSGFKFFIVTEKNHYVKVVAEDANGNKSNAHYITAQ